MVCKGNNSEVTAFSGIAERCRFLVSPTFPAREHSSYSESRSMAASVASQAIMSTVHKGTAFETRVLSLLQTNLSMTLTSVAGKGDGGIDLQGWWWLPIGDNSGASSYSPPSLPTANSSGFSVFHSTPIVPPPPEPRQKVRVLVQCKAEQKKVCRASSILRFTLTLTPKLGPKYVRELEGVVSRFALGQFKEKAVANVSPMVAILASESMFTQASVLHAMSSSLPFLLLHLPPVATHHRAETALTGSAVANPALIDSQKGHGHLDLGGNLEIRWERASGRKILDDTGRLSLWWKNKRLRNWTPA